MTITTTTPVQVLEETRTPLCALIHYEMSINTMHKQPQTCHPTMFMAGRCTPPCMRSAFLRTRKHTNIAKGCYIAHSPLDGFTLHTHRLAQDIYGPPPAHTDTPDTPNARCLKRYALPLTVPISPHTTHSNVTLPSVLNYTECGLCRDQH